MEELNLKKEEAVVKTEKGDRRIILLF